jgi:hypothetical protein
MSRVGSMILFKWGHITLGFYVSIYHIISYGVLNKINYQNLDKTNIS